MENRAMAHMQAQMTDKQLWVIVDGDGVDAFPADLIDVRELRKALDREDEYETAFEIVRDYVETHAASRILSIEIVKGYGVRSSAPGYMDCTPWMVYRNKREAIQAHREEESENI
jgi:hypothetical protein